jgi:hypothetical protein
MDSMSCLDMESRALSEINNDEITDGRTWDMVSEAHASNEVSDVRRMIGRFLLTTFGNQAH